MFRKRRCLCGGCKVILFYGYGATGVAGLGSTPPGAGQFCDTMLASIQGTGTRGRPVSTSAQEEERGVSQFDKRYKGDVCESS
jgi:hypothetical protein